MIEPLRRLLDQHRATANGSLWILTGDKKGFSLNLDNIARREIKEKIGGRWKGWQSFRRGLSTNLYELGVPPEVAQIVLRHADAATTRKHYLMLKSRGLEQAAMRKLEKAIRANQGPAVPRKHRRHQHKH